MRKFEDLSEAFKAKGIRNRVAIVCPNDAHTEGVVRRCIDNNIVDLTLFLDGNETPEFKEYCAGHESLSLKLINCQDEVEAAKCAVETVKAGRADVLMKGSISTDVLLHEVIDKDGGNGLIEHGKVMSHVTLVDSPVYHKLLMFSDAAVIPEPKLDQFDAMIRYDVNVARKLGIECPKIALIHFTEKINPRFTVTTEYETLKERSFDGDYGQVEMAGPMDVKTACYAESAEIKKISSDVPGDSDILIMPNLEASNTFYKTVSFFGQSRMAGLVTGTIAPVVVASRADSEESKFFSLIFACLVS